MFEALKQGFVGLTLFIMNWAGPSEIKPEIEVRTLLQRESPPRVECRLKSSWDPKLIDLIDAGIPLRFRFSARASSGVVVAFTRTLTFHLADYTYMFSDSLPEYVLRSGKYPIIDLALKDFLKWQMELPQGGRQYTIEATILPSYVSRLKRNVDMSGLWGQESVRSDVWLK